MRSSVRRAVSKRTFYVLPHLMSCLGNEIDEFSFIASRLPGPFGGKLIFKMADMHVSKWRVFKKAPQGMSMQDKAALMSI